MSPSLWISFQDSQPSVAPQPVGFTAGLRGCEERVAALRRSGNVASTATVVAVESFIAEVFPEKCVSCAYHFPTPQLHEK